MELNSTNFSIKKIEQATVGLHSAVIVHCTVVGFSGYIVLPEADLALATEEFSKGIIRVDKAKEAILGVTIKAQTGDTSSMPGESGGTSSGGPNTSNENGTERKRLHRNGNKAASTPDVKAPGEPIHSSNTVLPDTPAVTKRKRRTKEEMKIAAASNSTTNPEPATNTRRRRH